MRDPVFFATLQVFKQPESDDRLEPENDFLFLVDTVPVIIHLVHLDWSMQAQQLSWNHGAIFF